MEALTTSPEICEIRSASPLIAVDLGAIWAYRELLYFLIWRDVKVRYKQAVIGAAWAIIQPVLTVLIFTVIFGRFAKIPSEGIPYPVFAFPALLVWTYFAEAVRRASSGLVDDSDLVRKIYFPRLIIPLAGITTPIVDLGLAAMVLFGLLAVYGIVPSASVIFLPFFLLSAGALALAVGLWLAPVNVRFRDIKHALPFIIQVWMFASPVVYPAAIVPNAWRWLYDLNPMAWVIEGCRWSLLGSSPPDLQAVALGVGTIVALLVGGLIFFTSMERSFADVI